MASPKLPLALLPAFIDRLRSAGFQLNPRKVDNRVVMFRRLHEGWSHCYIGWDNKRFKPRDYITVSGPEAQMAILFLETCDDRMTENSPKPSHAASQTTDTPLINLSPEVRRNLMVLQAKWGSSSLV